MKRYFTLLTIGALLCWTVGCSKPAADATAKKDTATHADDGKDKHEHKDGDGHDHEHEEVGPHDGHLIELGAEEYHLELAHDDTDKTVTLYVLDGKAAKAVPIAEKELILNVVADGKPAQYKFPATPQKDEPAGQSSAFELKDGKLIDVLHAEGTTARVSLTINGKPYSGSLSHTHHH